MSISTLEMINALETGQIAKCLEVQEYSYAVKIINGSFYWIDINGIKSDLFSLSSDALNYRWEIIKDFVNFREAIEAFINGNKIYSYGSNGKFCNEYDPEYDVDGYIPISEILECYWSIEIK